MFTINSLKINEENFQNKPTLKISDVEGNLLNNETLIVNAFGLVNSERKKKDGIVFFGIKKESTNNNNTTDLVDYHLNEVLMKDFKDKIPNPMFAICYNAEHNDYFFNYCKKKGSNSYPSVILLKLDKPLILKKTETITLGTVFFELKTDKNDITITKLESDGKSQIKEVLKFNSDSTKEITIGRDSNCTINVNNKSLSRVNATIKFIKLPLKEILSLNASNSSKIYSQLLDSDINENSLIRFWLLIDGTYNKPSTNGVWLFSSHSYNIYDGFTIRLGKNKFKINKIDGVALK